MRSNNDGRATTLDDDAGIAGALLRSRALSRRPHGFVTAVERSCETVAKLPLGFATEFS